MDTIAAIATPGGRGGIGIVRVSGPAAYEIGTNLSGGKPEPRLARYCAFRGADGAVIDRGIMLYFQAPASYTGEDVLELHGHGGRVVMDLLLRAVIELGARPARPGEFTERAFLNGRMDLLQAEAVADLIDSLSESAARGAMRSLEGGFSARIVALIAGLTGMRAQLEADLDFPDEDVGTAGREGIARQLHTWLAELETVAGKARSGRVLREGLRVVIAGRPNAGKSSLMNRLLETDRAIVASEPGTTRDTLEEDVLIGGVRMSIVDTAGIRETASEVEAEGVRRSLAAVSEADAVLVVTVAGDPEAAGAVERHVPRSSERIVVENKIDLSGAKPALEQQNGECVVRLSAKTGEGVDLLVTALEKIAGEGAGEDAILARTRHVEALGAARAAAERGLSLAESAGAPELIAEELRQAQHHLGRITGAVSADDLLGEIFSRFCIGK